MAKREDMQAKTGAELTTLLSEARAALRGVRFSAAGSRPSDPSASRKLRKTVARVLTERSIRAKKMA